LNCEQVAEALSETRERTLALVRGISDSDLERVHSPLMSPLVWDLGHIAAFEDLWLGHRYGGLSLLRPDLMDVYDAFETPRAGRGDLPFLRTEEAREYLESVRARTLEVIECAGVGDGMLHEMVIRHEQQHGETMLQTIELARLNGYQLDPALDPGLDRVGDGFDHSAPAGHTGLELVEIPGGPFMLGAPTGGFAYDNERPRRRTDVRRYLIGRTPITNASYLTFVEGGGYERREWWSDEGWAWKEQFDITRPAGWTATLDGEWRVDGLKPLEPDRPVVHVSWFEADAFARSHEGRLPTEEEWEKAATWNQERQRSSAYPWGDDPPVPGLHANLDQVAPGPMPVGSRAGASAYGCLGMLGDAWEWTTSRFGPYPGFVAHPYREYSEVFFGGEYRVLRGASWATRARVASASFRNWDFPQRRQIFAGLRIARDA
jgi:iron(II)-dependent oxidoreductase